MGENKGQTIFLSVIGIATLLVAIIGATFAYFTTTMGNKDAVTGTVTTATISAVTLAGTTFSGENIMPGWTSGEKTFTISTQSITGTASAEYACKIVKTGEGNATDFEYQITGADDTTYGEWTAVPATATDVATGTIATDNLSDAYKIQFRFKETGAEQTNQGQTFGASVTCDLTKVNGKVGQ